MILFDRYCLLVIHLLLLFNLTKYKLYHLKSNKIFYGFTNMSLFWEKCIYALVFFSSSVYRSKYKFLKILHVLVCLFFLKFIYLHKHYR